LSLNFILNQVLILLFLFLALLETEIGSLETYFLSLKAISLTFLSSGISL